MRIHRIVFALALLLAFSVQGFAKESISSEIKTESSKPTAEANDASMIQTPLLAIPEQNQQEPKNSNTCLFELDFVNLSFSNENIPDTTNFSVIEYYIKNVAPITKKVGSNSKSIEAIEGMLDVL